MDKLIEYGHSFQQKFLASLLSDKDYLHQIIDILDENQFDSEANIFIAKTIKTYFLEYNSIPTLDVFSIHIKKLNNDLLKTSIVENLKSIYKNIQVATDLEAIKSEALNFFKNQNLKCALIDSVDLLELNKFDEIRRRLELAFRSGESKKSGHDYRKDIDQRYVDDKRNPLSSGFDLIDEVTDGGLGAGDLGVIIGSKGSGKCVGGNTEIEIRYDEIGIEVNTNVKKIIIWFDPWEKFNNREILHGVQDEIICHKRQKQETIKIKDLFKKLEIGENEHDNLIPPFDLYVNGPYGFYKILNLFRTEKQIVASTYFANNKVLETSLQHRIKANGEWKEIQHISETDVIETKTGVTKLKSRKKKKEKILYDITVDKVNCYYANEIVSHNSWSLINIAANALKQGKFVVYYTLELLDTYVAKRFDTYFTGITPSNLKYHLEDVKETIDSLNGEAKLLTQYYPTKSVSTLSIESHLQLIQLMHRRKPDLVLVDYADLLKNSYNDKNLRTDENLSNIYQELRGIAGKFELPLWTVSQTNRAGSTKEIIQGDDISDAFSKIFIADLVASFSRLLNDKIAGTGRMTLLHNRYGPDGITFPTKINFATGKMTLYNPESDSGKELKKDMDNGGEVTRQYLKNKFDELSK